MAGLQAEIAARVFRKIAPELTSAETRRILRKRRGRFADHVKERVQRPGDDLLHSDL